ncbi:MAG: anaerobic glycerol-3-phosphate dehydrogenase subunit C [Chloroflexi bacterium]|nr:anaerobic glycerol-3-phosphate dehydrogenase subunit C [Chloroflexota bacterium]
MEDIRFTLDHCVKCNICTSMCPVSRVTPLFPGPKYAGPQAQRLRYGPSTDRSVDFCSGCGICSQVCPHGVKIAEINAKARHTMYQECGIPLRNQIIARPDVLGRLASPAAPVINLAMRLPGVRRAMEAILHIHHAAPMPSFSFETFPAWFRNRRQQIPSLRNPSSNHGTTSGATTPDETVVYYHGCATHFYEPRIGKAAIKVLERNGYQVIVPEQGCCGLPLMSNGNFEAARQVVRFNVARLLPYARQGLPIVATSSSCSLMLKREVREILDMQDDDTALVSAHLYDICEFLLIRLAMGQLDIAFQPIPLRVPYHAPCQLRGHGFGKPALELLQLIPELETIEMSAACCGTAGTYGYKQEKYSIAMAVGEELFSAIHSTNPHLSACDSETCRWQIVHGTGLPSVHPIELLAAAYQ